MITTFQATFVSDRYCYLDVTIDADTYTEAYNKAVQYARDNDCILDEVLAVVKYSPDEVILVLSHMCRF